MQDSATYASHGKLVSTGRNKPPHRGATNAELNRDRRESVLNDLLEGPCIFCGYNSFGYWQEATHSRKCPWFFIGSEREREIRLREVIEKLVQENKLLDVMKSDF